jgi:hypothetical protein
MELGARTVKASFIFLPSGGHCTQTTINNNKLINLQAHYN